MMMPMMNAATTLFLLSSIIGSSTIEAHTRLECPPSRSGETGAKIGPCDAPDDLNLPAYPLQPGLNTITWLESISHPGAPGRFALSLDGSDEGFESCILLDHVPHDELSYPTFTDPLTYHRSSITLWIPDVYCERCNLQLITFMTDEVHGVPDDTTCAYYGAQNEGKADASLPFCPVVYHSCAPVSINGTVPRNNITECNTAEFERELDWPFMVTVESDGTESEQVYSTYYAKGNPGLYNYTTAQLQSGGAPIEGCTNYQYCDPDMYYNPTAMVPASAAYASPHGTCADIVNMKVENFELGKLPSVPRNESELVYVKPDLNPCTPCDLAAPCYLEGACFLRDKATGQWTGPAEQCNFAPEMCEECFIDSLCYGYGRDEEAPVTIDDGSSAESPAATAAPESGGGETDGAPTGGDEIRNTSTSGAAKQFWAVAMAFWVGTRAVWG